MSNTVIVHVFELASKPTLCSGSLWQEDVDRWPSFTDNIVPTYEVGMEIKCQHFVSSTLPPSDLNASRLSMPNE